jgi:hypothetical protein
MKSIRPPVQSCRSADPRCIVREAARIARAQEAAQAARGVLISIHCGSQRYEAA